MPRFVIFGRHTLDVERVADRWVVYHRGEGTRRPAPDMAVPDDVAEDDLARVLEDLLHELGRPGATVERIADGR